MNYYARVYAGEHDTLKVSDLLKEKWPDIDWDVVALSPEQAIEATKKLGGAEERDDDLRSMSEVFPMYRAFSGDSEIPEMTEMLAQSPGVGEIEIEGGGLSLGILGALRDA